MTTTITIAINNDDNGLMDFFEILKTDRLSDWQIG